MTTFTVDQRLPDVVVVAKNFAADSENKMHADDTAPRYGFKGGLVPGVGTYGYMTGPVVDALGLDWLERGTMNAKFIKPVYDGERITIESRIVSTEPLRILLSALNEEGTLCAVGEASLPDKDEGEGIDLLGFPLTPTPEPEERYEPNVEALKEGTQLGSLCFPYDLHAVEEGIVRELEDERDVYRGDQAACHPAFVVHQANEVLKRSIELGPWIHTESNVIYHALPKQGELACLRARVRNAYIKRGHDIIVCGMVLTGEGDRLLAHLVHNAIVRPKPVD